MPGIMKRCYIWTSLINCREVSHELATWPWTGHWTPWNLSFLIHNMGLIIPNSQVWFNEVVGAIALKAQGLSNKHQSKKNFVFLICMWLDPTKILNMDICGRNEKWKGVIDTCSFCNFYSLRFWTSQLPFWGMRIFNLQNERKCHLIGLLPGYFKKSRKKRMSKYGTRMISEI